MFFKKKPDKTHTQEQKTNPRVESGIFKFKCQGDKVDTKYSLFFRKPQFLGCT